MNILHSLFYVQFILIRQQQLRDSFADGNLSAHVIANYSVYCIDHYRL